MQSRPQLTPRSTSSHSAGSSSEPPVKRTVSIPPTLVGAPGDSFFVGVYFHVQGSLAAFPVDSACNTEREFVSSTVTSLHDARDLSDDVFTPAVGISPLVFACDDPFKTSLSLLIRPQVLAYYDCDADTTPDSCQGPVVDTNADDVPDDCQCLTDLNGDGVADVMDFGRLATGFGTTAGATLIDGDLDADADVDLFDLGVFMTNFGAHCRATPTPTRGAPANAIVLPRP